MSDAGNRTLIIFVAAAVIVLMGLVVFVTWSAAEDVVEGLRDFVQYLDDNRDDAGKLIVTLAALVVAVLALLLIILEVAPAPSDREVRVEQAGATTIMPVETLRLRVEEALLALPDVMAARARIFSKDKGLGTALDLTVSPGSNLAHVAQEASRVVVDVLQDDMGLPVAGAPTVRLAFPDKKGTAKDYAAKPAAPPPAPPAYTQSTGFDPATPSVPENRDEAPGERA